jgi:hypothetical protein
MKVQNMTNARGNKIANQFIITDHEQNAQYFQSYDSIIALKIYDEIEGGDIIHLDSKYWDYSKTTGKYRNMFLGETKKETEDKIKSGEYILTNLN